MARVTAACGGFLLAVLWMDLMFDVRAARLGATDAATVGSIAAYYRRVTTDAFPMNRLIGAVMVLTVAAATWRALHVRPRRWSRAVGVLLAAGPIGLALFRVFPNAVRLGAGTDPVDVQAGLARAILHDHVACFVAIALFTGAQLWDRDGRSGDGKPPPGSNE